MTARDRLHELVDQLDDDAAERLLKAANALVPAPRPSPQGGLPEFVGSFTSGRADVSERAEEILRDELGGPGGS
jgi:streptomycin 6-kinase